MVKKLIKFILISLEFVTFWTILYLVTVFAMGLIGLNSQTGYQIALKCNIYKIPGGNFSLPYCFLTFLMIFVGLVVPLAVTVLIIRYLHFRKK